MSLNDLITLGALAGCVVSWALAIIEAAKLI